MLNLMYGKSTTVLWGEFMRNKYNSRRTAGNGYILTHVFLHPHSKFQIFYIVNKNHASMLSVKNKIFKNYNKFLIEFNR